MSPGQVESRTIRSAEKGPYICLFSGCGCIICHDTICLRPAKPQTWQDRGEMNDGLPSTASFASLTIWGKSWRDVARGTKKKSMGGGRAGNDCVRETQQ